MRAWWIETDPGTETDRAKLVWVLETRHALKIVFIQMWKAFAQDIEAWGMFRTNNNSGMGYERDTHPHTHIHIDRSSHRVRSNLREIVQKIYIEIDSIATISCFGFFVLFSGPFIARMFVCVCVRVRVLWCINLYFEFNFIRNCVHAYLALFIEFKVMNMAQAYGWKHM